MNREFIERSLLEVDGSCRDVNFAEHIPATGAIALLASIAANWGFARASDTEGDPVKPEDFGRFFGRHTGMLSTIWEGPLSPRHLQAYFHWAKHDEIFCELTFFPQDVDAETFTLAGFMALLATWAKAAQSREYYVRVENGAWRHGVHGRQAGVIFSHKSILLPTV